ncbi:transcriptional regulator [Pseudoduganella sp. FT93W]|uniref:Transcriptional regulator n=1 Tax=Duganella fentianensis TaxID=2692177 RepID=A0A845HZW5_9BURK|nr:sigma-E factor negative regulatory protein [Duganella fentianensis]MYN45357.1 transcriptional regulator [Duganella fentianensis]
MDIQRRMREHLSALADGELDESERELALAALATAEGQQHWRAYHLVRDTLQADAAAAALPSPAFQARLAQRLAAEPAHGAAGTPDADTQTSTISS